MQIVHGGKICKLPSYLATAKVFYQKFYKDNHESEFQQDAANHESFSLHTVSPSDILVITLWLSLILPCIGIEMTIYSNCW